MTKSVLTIETFRTLLISKSSEVTYGSNSLICSWVTRLKSNCFISFRKLGFASIFLAAVQLSPSRLKVCYQDYIFSNRLHNACYLVAYRAASLPWFYWLGDWHSNFYSPILYKKHYVSEPFLIAQDESIIGPCVSHLTKEVMRPCSIRTGNMLPVLHYHSIITSPVTGRGNIFVSVRLSVCLRPAGWTAEPTDLKFGTPIKDEFEGQGQRSMSSRSKM